jgi:hypothetical protein
VKKTTLLLTSALLALFACSKKEQTLQEPVPPVKQEVTAQKFVPPTDSTITETQLQGWFVCNPLLDTLAFQYSDSFKTTDPTQRLKYQEDFTRAQDKICVLSGLAGGYREYRWIMENMGNPKNKQVLAGMKTEVY